MKNKIIFISKILFIIFLFYFLIKKGFVSIEATQAAISEFKYTLPALFLTLIANVISSIRLQILLKSQKILIPLKKTIELNWIGNFFNLALPGAVSGDFVKAFYIGKEAEDKKSKAFGSILFDRIVGLSALIFISAFALIVQLNRYQDSSMIHSIQIFIQIGAACIICFYGYLFSISEKKDPILKFLQKVETRFKGLSSLTQTYQSVRCYHHYPIEVIQALILSIIVHVIVGINCYLFACALGEHQISLSSLYIIIPLGLLVTAIPVAPGGIGTGNLAFLYFFQLLGSDRGADIYSLFALSNLITGAIGGILYLRMKSKSNLMKNKLN